MSTTPTPPVANTDRSLRFRDVFREEIKEIQSSRVKRREMQSLRNDEIEARRGTDAETRDRPLEHDLIGLAFSGGGVHGATFNLGVIQALAKETLLRRMDYLSTVSSGGYIGSWLSSWAYHFREQAEVPCRIADKIIQIDPASSDLKSQVEGVHQEMKRLRDQVSLTESGQICAARFAHLNLKSPTLKDELTEIAAALRQLRDQRAGATNQIAAIESQLNQRSVQVGALPEPREVNFLRRYSNYLTPRLGVLSGDSMAFGGTYLRNVVLNQIIVISALLALLLVPHTIVLLVRRFSDSDAVRPLVASAILLLAWHSWRIARNMNPETDDSARKVIGDVAFPQLVFCFFVTWSLWLIIKSGQWGIELLAVDWFTRFMVAGAIAASYTGLWVLSAFGSKPHGAVSIPLIERHLRWVPVSWALPAGLVGGATVLIGARLFGAWEARALVTFAVPLVTLAVLLVGTIHLGLIGRQYPDSLREWWSRMGAVVLIMAVLYFALFVVTLYAPGWVSSVWIWAVNPTSPGGAGSTERARLGAVGRLLWQTLGGLGVTGAITGWIVVTLRGLFVAKSGVAGGSTETSSPAADRVVRIATIVFVSGLMVALSVVAVRIVRMLDRVTVCCDENLWWKTLLVAASLLVLSLAMGERLDVNEFSLYPAYRNRIVRCYMGATNSHRDPQMFTGFDERDDIFLQNLRGLGAPLHILNATLNILKGKELALQTRRVGSFTFSPLYSGFDYVDDQKPDSASGGVALAAMSPTFSWDSPTTTASYYRKTQDYGKSSLYPGIRIGTAAAIVSPRVGFRSVLLAIFGYRLGLWLGNPRSRDWWESSRPRSSWRALFRELTGSADDLKPEVYLSDGGDFDNLGLYELVRRRCRLIISIDTSADEVDSDGAYFCGALAQLTERCEADFAARVEIDLKGIGRKSSEPFRLGRIYYPDGREGVLIYVKPCLIPGLPRHVSAYAQVHPRFPNEAGTERFVNDSQFECYRALGYHCGMIAANQIRLAINGESAPVQPNDVLPLPFC